MNATFHSTRSTKVEDKLQVPVGRSSEKVDIDIGTEAGEEPNELKQTWRLLTSRRMLKLVPLLSYSGISMAIFQAAIVPLMTITMADKGWDPDY